MFQLTKDELENWKSQIAISNKEKIGLRKPPLVFTEQGVSMLSSVLNSDRAIQVNIQIMRAFTQLRKIVATNEDIMRKLEDFQDKYEKHDKEIDIIIETINKMIDEEQKIKEIITEKVSKERKIGFSKD